MSYKYYTIHIIIWFSFMYLFGCKKDVDQTGPSIELTSSTENQTFNVMDIVSVKGKVIDETKITNVTVSLVNAQQEVVHVSVAATVSSPIMNFDVHYSLDNIHLETGTYYFLVTASDGKNDTRVYKKIYLIAVPRVLEKIFVVSTNNSSVTNWGYIDGTFSSIVPYTFFVGDCIGSSSSDYYQQLFNCGNYTGSYSSYDIATNGLKYTITGSNSLNPYFTGYTVTAKNTYVARYDGFVKGYDNKGNSIYNAQANSGYYVQHFIFNDNRMIAEQKDKITHSKILVTYYPSGIADVQTSIFQDVVKMIEKNNNNVFIFGNASGQGVIQLFDRINNNLWNPYAFSLPVGSILSAVKVDNDTYLIGHSNGTIYKYQYQMGSLTTYLTGYIAKQLKYDDEANKLYVVENNKITSINYSTAGILNILASGEHILDIHLLYNR